MRAPVRPTIYDAAFWLFLMVTSPYFAFRLATSRRWRDGFARRAGLARLPRGMKGCVWIHGVSVGEVKSARHLISLIHAKFEGAPIVISSTTPEGYKAALDMYPGHTVIYYPLDVSVIVGKFFEQLRPRAVVLIELEVWPNFLLMAKLMNVPVMIVNGRISERSFQQYHRFKRFVGHIFDSVTFFSVQTGEYAERLLALGVHKSKVVITGNIKYDSIRTEIDKGALDSLRKQLGFAKDQPLLLGGSTHKGEEEALLSAYQSLRGEFPGLRLVLAPRHMQRLEEVSKTIMAAGLRSVLRTEMSAGTGGRSLGSDEVLLVDTMGELDRLYGLSTISFVGGSLVPVGGHNMLEPAGIEKPVIFGPEVFNFQEEARKLLDVGAAVQIQTGSTLAEAVCDLLRNPVKAREMAIKAREVVLAEKGSTLLNIQLLEKILSGALARELAKKRIYPYYQQAPV
ncbi:MAG: 3-deoxy-D-manno-octulosonic acid transferase [Planctomycetes bacterium]|nr:3-deoxy-D-manno-octulosonic acid transferase [Planctomycetota bacterium]